MRAVATLALLTSLALAVPCVAAAGCAELDADAFHALVEEADTAIDNDDVIRHGELFAQLREAVPCLSGPVPIKDWAQFLLGKAMVEAGLNQPWEIHLQTALRAYPSLPRQDTPATFRDYPPPPPQQVADGELAPDYRYFLDGMPLIAVPALEGVHIVQRVRKREWESMLLENEPFPEAWTQPGVFEPVVEEVPQTPATLPPAPPPRLSKGVLYVSGALAGVGTTTALTAFGVAKADHPFGEGSVKALRTTNMMGWTAAGVGFAGLLLVITQPRGDGITPTIGPDGAGLQGRF